MMNATSAARANTLSPTKAEQSRNYAALRSNTVIVASTTAVIAGSAWLVWAARTAMLLIFAGLLFAVLLRAASGFIQRRTGMSIRLSLFLLLTFVLSIVCLGGWLRGSEIGSQIEQLQQSLPGAVQQLIGVLPTFPVGRWLLKYTAHTRQQLPGLIEILPGVRGFLSTTFGLIAGFALVVYVGITVALEPETYRRGLEQLFAPDSRPKLAKLVDEVAANLQRWMLVRLAAMCFVGFSITLGLFLLRVPLAGTLGTFAAGMTFIPNFGPLLSVLPPALLAFTISPRQALLVCLLFAGVHFVEGFLVTPMAERRVVHLPPALTLWVQLLLGTFCGGIGVALAAPLTVVAMVVVRQLHMKVPAAS